MDAVRRVTAAALRTVCFLLRTFYLELARIMQLSECISQAMELLSDPASICDRVGSLKVREVCAPKLRKVAIRKGEDKEELALIRVDTHFHCENELDQVRTIELVELFENEDFVVEHASVRAKEFFERERWIVFVFL